MGNKLDCKGVHGVTARNCSPFLKCKCSSGRSVFSAIYVISPCLFTKPFFNKHMQKGLLPWEALGCLKVTLC